MMEYKGLALITPKEACQVLDCTLEAVRQMIYRGRFKRHKIRGRLYLENDQVSDYYPSKMKLEAFNSISEEEMTDEFFGFGYVQGLLNYSSAYLKKMVKEDIIKGYCTADGQILISKKSLDNFMGVACDADDI